MAGTADPAETEIEVVAETFVAAVVVLTVA